MKPRVLIIGTRFPGMLSFSAALASTCDLTITDEDPSALALFQGVASRLRCLAWTSQAELFDYLVELQLRERFDVIVPGGTTEALALARYAPTLATLGVTVMGWQMQALARVLDRWTLGLVLEGQVPTPATALIDEHLADTSGCHSAIVRPRYCRSTVRSRPSAVNGIDDVPRDCSYVAQVHLSGRPTRVDVLLGADGEPLCAVPRRSLAHVGHSAGAWCTFHDEERQAIAIRAATAVGASYFATVVLRDDEHGRPYVVDVLPFFPDSLPLLAAAGVPAPALCLEQALGARSEPIAGFSDVRMLRWWASASVGISPMMQEPASPMLQELAS